MIRPEKKTMRPRRSIGSFVLTTATFLAFMGIVWHAYQDGDADVSNASVPVVRASIEPIKVKPADEKGMNIPYQDVLVFDQIDTSAQSNDKAERVQFQNDNESDMPLPPLEGLTKVADDFDVETKENRDEVAALLTYEDTGRLTAMEEPAVVDQLEKEAAEPQIEADKEAVDELASKVREMLKEGPPATQTETAEEKVEKVEEEKSNIVIKVEEPVKKEPVKNTPVEKVTQKAKTVASKMEAGDYVVQLGAVRSRDDAKSEWQRLQKKLPGVLDDLTLNIESVDLGEKGTFYRIQGGSLSKASADQVCDKVTKSKVAGCLVKKKAL